MIDAQVTEAHVVSEPLSRQVRRNIERKAAKRGVPCRYCPEPVRFTPAVLANGQVAHAACVERINDMVDEMNHRTASERLSEAGFVIERPELITL